MKKRILHLIPTLASGGAERQLVNVVGSTSPDEFEHLVCTLSDPLFYAPMIWESGYEIRELKTKGKRPWLSGANKFFSVIREYQPDLINTWLFDANIIGRLAKLRGKLKIPIVVSLQLTDYEPETITSGNWSPKKVAALRLIDKTTISLTKPYFIACSRFVQDSFVERLNIDLSKTNVLYNFVNPDALECEPDAAEKVRQELNIPPDAFVYLNLGRISPEKNQMRLTEAFAQILPSVSQAFLVIVGAGVPELENELKKAVKRLQIEHRVRFAGRREDVGACLEMADVFVFPSLSEGLPLSLIEAMFKSLPCIAGDIKVMREVITDESKGLLVNPHQTEEIARAMTQLYENPDLCRRLGENAWREVEQNFNAKKAVVGWENFYRQIIRENE